MNYHKITYPDVNNGDGCRATLWVSGCTHHCKGCHNPETWDFGSGVPFTEKSYSALKDVLSLDYIDGLTLSGGDPLCNYVEVLRIVKRVKADFPKKTIWLYTGCTMQEIIDGNMTEILIYLDVVVDGRFHPEERDTTLAFRGSANQHIWRRAIDGKWWKDD
ncbi:MAG: anaerobic ribonucleoside-triphosphate reductase activating protein [Bacteroidales bacterium]|nr:anaerobic ribonucleoside-triphosphate reductase activating protein [Bacteroidales bacterium]